MNLKNLFRVLLNVAILTMFFVGSTTFANTWYVDAQYGLNTYDGTSDKPNTPFAGNGPKGAISDAIAAAADGDIIIIAPRGNASKYETEPGNLITVNKTLTFRINNNATAGFGGTPNSGNVVIDATIVLNDVTAAPTGLTLDANGTAFLFQIQSGRNLTLTAASITGAANLIFPGTSTITRTLATTTLDALPNYSTTDITLTYGLGAAGANVTVGPEWNSATRIKDVNIDPGAFTVSIGSARTMFGQLTITSGTLALGSNDLTLNLNGANKTHTLGANSITSTSVGTGYLIFTGAATFLHTVNGGTGGNGIPNVRNNSASDLTITNATLIKGNVENVSAGDVLLSAATQINGSVSNSGSVTNDDNNGNITLSVGVTINVNVINNKTVLVNDDVATTNSGNINFPSAAITILGNVDNTSTVTNNNATVGNGLSSSGNINFANIAAANNVIIQGRLYNASTVVAAANVTNVGDILWTARTSSTITVGQVASNKDIQLSTSVSGAGTITTSGIIDLRGVGTGLITVNGNVNASATGVGQLLLASPLDVSGTFSLTPVSGNSFITVAGAGAVDIDGAVSRGTVGTGDINFSSTGNYGLGAAVTNNGATGAKIIFANASVDINGLLSNTSTGSIEFAATNKVVSFDGGVLTSGLGDISFTGALAGSTVTMASLTIQNGTFNIAGSANSTDNFTVTGNYVHTGGTLTLGTGARVFNVGGSSNQVNTSAVFSNGALTDLTFNGTVAQTLSVTSGGTVNWPGDLTIVNTLLSGLNAWTLTGGNLQAAGDVTFSDGQVVINGVYLFIRGDFFYDNVVAESYLTNAVGAQEGFISMRGTVAADVSSTQATANFSNFEVDNAAGVTFGPAAPDGITTDYVMQQIFALTNGVVTVEVTDLDELIFNNTPDFPEIRRNGGSFAVAPTFTSAVDVLYLNSAVGSMNTGAELPTLATKLNDLDVNSVGSATGITFTANVTVNGQLSVASGRTVTLGAFDLNMGNQGSALVNRTSPSKITLNGTADITGGAGSVINLDDAAGTAIVGSATVAADGNIITVDDINVLTGSVGNTTAGIRQIVLLDQLTINGSGTISSLSFTNQTAIVDFDNIDGDVTFAGAATGGITLGSRVQIGGGDPDVTLNAGVLNLGAFNLILEQGAASNNTIVGNAVTINSTGGYFTFEGIDGGDLTVGGGDVTIPYLRLNLDNATDDVKLITNDVIVSNTLDMVRGRFDDNGGGEFVVVTGNIVNISTNSAMVGGGGNQLGLELSPTTGTLTATIDGAGLFDVTNLILDGDVLLAGTSGGIIVGGTTAGTLTHTSGNLNFGSRNITIGSNNASTFTRTAGTYTGTGYLIWDGTNPVLFTNGPTMSIPNFRITDDVTLQTASSFTVEKKLDLVDALLTHTVGGSPRLSIGLSGGTIPLVTVSDAGNLDVAAAGFPQGQIDLTFASIDGAATTTGVSALVWPATPGTLVNTLTINGDDNADKWQLGALNRTVNGTSSLNLTRGTLEINGAGTLTLADGMTINRDARGFITDIAGGGTLSASNVNLVYSDVSSSGVYAAALEYTLPTVNSVTVNTGTLVTFGAKTILSTVTVNGTFTLTGAVTVTGFADINGTLVLGGQTLTLLANFDATGATLTANAAAGDKVVFGGGAAQSFILPGNTQIRSVDLNKTNDEVVTISGGNLTVGGASGGLNLMRGIINMASAPISRTLILANSTGAVQGFTRNVTVPQKSHIAGKVQINITAGATGRYDIPVGLATGNKEYRPAAITFPIGSAPVTNTNIFVTAVDGSPLGQLGLPTPTPDDQGVTIGNVSDYYWLIGSSVSLGSSQNYDIELNGTNLNRPVDNVQDLRIMRRFDGDVAQNAWLQLGTGSSYLGNNILQRDSTGIPPYFVDTVVTVRSSSAQGAIVAQNARYAIGIPTQEPVWDSTPADQSIKEGSVFSFTYVAHDLDLNPSSIVYSILSVTPSLPVSDSAKINYNNVAGAFRFAPGFNFAPASYTFTIKAAKQNDPTSFVTDVVVIAVTDSNRAPVFTAVPADDSITNAEIFTFDYNATDPDGSTPTYSLGSVVPPLTGGSVTVNSTTGVLTFDPVFANAVATYVVTVNATDGSLTTSDAVSITVTQATLRGDADADGQVTTLDASEILQHLVGLDTLTTPQELLGGDADLDGNITPLDAYFVLYYLTHGNTWPTIAKIASASGNVEFGQLRSDVENKIVSIPINLNGSKNVISAFVELNIQEKYADLKNVSVNLPEGWMSSSRFADGKLKIVMTGMTALKDGDFAVVNLTLKDKEAKFDVTGNITLNNDLSKNLSDFSVKLIPAQFELSQNYPNPFNPATKIKYSLAADSKVSLTVYDMLGQKVASVVNTIQEAGYYTVEWNGSNDFGQKVSSGVYIYRLQAGDFVKTMKMNLLK